MAYKFMLGNVDINSGGSARLHVGGGLGLATIAIVVGDSPYDLNPVDHFQINCDTSGGDITLNLPELAKSTGAIFAIKKVAAANDIIIDPDGAELIDNASTVTLGNDNDCLVIMSAGGRWRILAKMSAG